MLLRVSMVIFLGLSFVNRAHATQKQTLKSILARVGENPADEAAIKELRDWHKLHGNEKLALMAEKGLIAAERRNLSPKGPIYIVDENGVMWTPHHCIESGENLKKLYQSGKISKEELRTSRRARAFYFFASGKAVALGPWMKKRVYLDKPLCLKSPNGIEQLVFQLKKEKKPYVVVPSWLVAGHKFSKSKDTTKMTYDTDAHGQPIKTRNLSQLVIQEGQLAAKRLHLYQFADNIPFERGGYSAYLQSIHQKRTSLNPVQTYYAYIQPEEPNFEKPVLPKGEPRCERLPEGCELGNPYWDLTSERGRDIQLDVSTSPTKTR